MDIEKLTKMQIVLLTLLVSFVTSIATGIVTVTLMDQAPPVITQTLNRVVERTVERVVPDESKQGASVVTKETTVVVKEEDLITDSINKNSKSVVRIYESLKDDKVGTLSGLGIVVSSSGLIATDPSVIKKDSKYIIETPNGKTFNSYLAKTEKSESLTFLAIEVPEGEKVTFPEAIFSKHKSLKLGQTILSLTGEKRTDVAIGIIAGLIEEDILTYNNQQSVASSTAVDNVNTKPDAGKVLSFIKTSIDKKEVIAGSPLIDIFGEVIGISTIDLSTGKTAIFRPVIGMGSVISNIAGSEESTVKITQ